MTKLSWGTPGERFYESGVDRGVLFVDDTGYAWNGLISVQEKSAGGEPQPYYIDGFKYLQLSSSEEFEATLDAFAAPREFGPCDGSTELYAGLTVTQQPRKQFGLSYRTKVGNDVTGLDLGYKIHIVYNALAAPTDREHKTIEDSPEAVTLSWDITTNPPAVSGIRPTAHFVIDTRRASSGDIVELENLIYGTESTTSHLPTAADLIAIFA